MSLKENFAEYDDKQFMSVDDFCTNLKIKVNFVSIYLTYEIFSFKNGSLTRERFRDLYTADKSWKEFSSALKTTSPGNNGNIGDFHSYIV